ncbi:MAG: hypothetical protein IPL36_05385 [Nigerium sp.]|nr:hypothetical protein [Nigerium sp.]
MTTTTTTTTQKDHHTMTITSTAPRADYFTHFNGKPDGSKGDHARRALALLGLRLTSDGSCPRKLAGLPHVDITCWCASRLNDHGRRYRDADGNAVVVWEPYDADADAHDLAPILTAAGADGLRVHVTSASPWYPGRTVALIFTTATTTGN